MIFLFVNLLIFFFRKDKPAIPEAYIPPPKIIGSYVIISLISVEISRVVSHRIVFTFPDSVPSAVTNFVNSLMPLALNIIVIYGANLILVALSGKSMPNLIMSFLTPAISWG